MELRQVKYFVAVAEELHFGRAAERLNIAQPALSQQIIRLEQELGGRLLTRTKRSVSLTDAGRVFLTEAKLLLVQSALVEETAKRAFSGEVGEMSLGFVESAIWDILPNVLRKFQIRYPDVRINLFQKNTIDQIEAIKSGQMKVGIVGLPIDDQDLRTHLIRKESFLVALPSDHFLSTKADVHVSDLVHERFISTIRENSAQYYDKMVKVCMDAGFSPTIAQEANEMQTVLALVSSGIGIALIHESAKHLRNDLIYKKLSGTNQLAYQLSFVWRRDEDSPVVNGFLNVVRNLYP